MKFVPVSQLLRLVLWSLLGSDVVLSQLQVLLSHLGISLLVILNQLSEFCCSSWLQQAEGSCALLFTLSTVLWGLGHDLGHNLHSCPASSPLLFPAGPPLLICARPVPSIHQLCCPWGALTRGTLPTTLLLFVLVARHSESLFWLVQLPHWVKSFWGLLTPWALLLSSGGGEPSPSS